MKRNHLRLVYLYALALILIFSCNIPAAINRVPSVQSTQANVAAIPMVTVGPDATATPTPFQPVKDPTRPAYTSTPTPISHDRLTENCSSFLPPSQGASIEIPPPVCPQLPHPSGQFNVLLMGSDQRPDSGGYRTDTMILVTLNPLEGTVSMTSFPRDLYVYIPGWTMQRINTADAHGGFPLTQLTFQYNFGVNPDRYVMINFWSFLDLINSLGGIDVNVAQALTDHRAGYGNYTVLPGINHMDAETALWYVRSRYSTSDFERTQRQQEVIVAIFNRLISLDVLERAPEIYDIYKDSVTTNLTFSDMTAFLPLAGQLLTGEGIRHYFIGRPQVTSWRTPGGAQVLLPNRDAVLDVMRQALNSEDPVQ